MIIIQWVYIAQSSVPLNISNRKYKCIKPGTCLVSLKCKMVKEHQCENAVWHWLNICSNERIDLLSKSLQSKGENEMSI